MNPVLIVIPILTVLMFDLGLELRPADFSLLRRSPRAVMVGLCGQIVLLPAVALGLIWVFDIDPVMAVGLMLIACSPGGSSSNVFSALAGGDVALSVSLTALSSVITLITLPLILSFSVGSWIELPLGSLIGQNIVLALLPMFAGMAVRAKLPAAASRIHVVLRRMAFPALMLLAAVFFVVHHRTISANFSTLGPAVLLLLCLSMCGGAALAAISGLVSVQRRTLVIEVGMQNSAQAIALASSPLVFADDSLAVPAIVYALLMNVVLLAYVGLCRYRLRAAVGSAR